MPFFVALLLLPVKGGIPIKSPVSWVGNKTALLPYINAILPLRCPRFVDVFGGSGSVFLSRHPQPGDFEVYNDFDSDLTNLFRCFKEKPMELLCELGFLTLNSRDDFIVLRKFIAQDTFDDSYMTKELELTNILLKPPEAEEMRELMTSKAKQYDVRRAAKYLRLIRYSYSSGLKSFASQPFDIRKLFRLIWQLYDRMANVVVENQDFETLIRHYDRPDTVFYCDPPYYESEGMYAACFSKEDHIRLWDTLKNIKGKFLLSYNDCPFIREVYADFHVFECSRVHNMAQRYHAGAEYSELLIGNFDLLETQRNKPLQLCLGDDEDNIDYEKILRECSISCKKIN